MRRFILIILTGVLFCQGLSGAEWKAGFSQWRMERALDALEEFAGEIEDIREINGNMYYAALCKRINSYGREIIPLMLRDLEDKGKDWKYRYMLVDRLVFVKGKTSADQWEICRVLLRLLEDRKEKRELRSNVIDGLSRLAGSSSRMDDRKRVRVMEELLKIADNDGEGHRIRWEVIRDLSRFAKYDTILLEPMLRLSEEADRDMRAISISNLVTIAHFTHNEFIKSRIKSVLVDRLQVEQDDLVKEQIIYGIKTLKVREAIPLLMESLRDGRYCSRAQAAELLGIMKVREAVPLLIEGLKDNTPSMLRYEAALALGKIGDKRAVEPLINILNTGSSSAAARALGMLGDKRAVKPLMELLEREGYDPRTVEALIRLDAREAIPLIEEKMPKGKKLYGSEAEIKDKFERFKRGENIDWEEK